MSVHPTSENLTVLQLSGSPANAADETARAIAPDSVRTCKNLIDILLGCAARTNWAPTSLDRQYRRRRRAVKSKNCGAPNRESLSFAPRAARSGPLASRRSPDGRFPERDPAAAVRNPDAGAAAHVALRRRDRGGEVWRPRDGRRGQGARLRQGHGASGAVRHQPGGRAWRWAADRHDAE